MKNIGIFLITLFACIVFTSCETEAEKQARIKQQEANKIILSQEEFATLKELESNRGLYGNIPIDKSRVVPESEVGGNPACEPLSLDELLELYDTGKKRDWLLEHGFEVNYYIKMKQGKVKEYNQMTPSDFIGYGRCYYEDNALHRRVGLRVTHVRHQQIDYWTTFEDNFNQIEEELKAKGVEEGNNPAVDRRYIYKGIPIEFDVKKGSSKLNTPNIYKVKFKSTYSFNPTDVMSDKDKEGFKKMLDSKPQD